MRPTDKVRTGTTTPRLRFRGQEADVLLVKATWSVKGLTQLKRQLKPGSRRKRQLKVASIPRRQVSRDRVDRLLFSSSLALRRSSSLPFASDVLDFALNFA